MDFAKLLQILGLNRNPVQQPMYPYAEIEKQIVQSGNQPYFGYVSDEELLAMQNTAPSAAVDNEISRRAAMRGQNQNRLLEEAMKKRREIENFQGLI
jgi:hypothetical protein